MNTAQMEIGEHEETFTPERTNLLREELAGRVAAHRRRRTRVVPTAAEAQVNERPVAERGRAIAAAVAERFAHVPSYGAFLEAETENAIRQAEASARNAEAAMVAEMRSVEDLSRPVACVAVAHSLEAEEESTGRLVQASLVAPDLGAVLTVRLYENLGDDPEAVYARGSGEAIALLHESSPDARKNLEESRLLDEEIAFRQSPTVELSRPNVAIPGNLLEFPRHLVAARRARPRYAEGPLREDAETTEEHAQLRIFEVTPDQMSGGPAVETAATVWSSIWLDAVRREHSPETAEEAQFLAAQRPQTAKMERRVMAAMVDGCLIGAGFVGFATAFAWMAVWLPGPTVLAAGGLGVLAGMFVLYQMLFFTLSEATPGMRYARIGLCTLGDENPTRAAMRRRILAVILAACPLGIGFVWAWLDDDRLGWHDRISRMYQRSY